ncbi:MAG: glycoside hydrolase family 127 protein [Bryobacterales bacterium]|nr:glycoside hydrolase family 127 protein [Bryobacterales bacterium]
MKPLAWLCLASSFALAQAGPERSVILDLSSTPGAKLRTVPVSAVTLKGGFWESRRRTNVERSIPTLLQLLEEHGIADNFRRLSGAKSVPRKGPLFTDSDLYKWMEAAAWAQAGGGHPELRRTFDALTRDILAAQEPSGYLNTWFQEDRKSRRWSEMVTGHELYCLGHLLQAGIAYYRTTGDRTLLDGGIRFVEYLLRDFGPGKRPLLAGHPEIEMALVELYRTTHDRRYLALAGYILTGDGERLHLTPGQIAYMFSGRPFIDRTIMEGHAVRAGYAASGAADYWMETREEAYGTALERLWRDLTRSKMYITGGTGSRSAGEAFGDPYELPNAKAYTESCAAIANLMWNWRMLQATGEARFTGVMETALYNSINSGMSLSGTMYCYRNPLELTREASQSIRNPWYTTTCCPPNLERLFASLPGYFYGVSGEGLWVHLYDRNTLAWKLGDGTPLAVQMETKYPWEGQVDMTVSPRQAREFTLFLRIPAWSDATTVSVNGARVAARPEADRYLAVKRTWKPGDRVRLVFSMTPQEIAAHPRALENQGRVAVRRGPLVYVLEQEGQAEGVNVLESKLLLTGDGARDFAVKWEPDLLGGIVTLRHKGAHGALDTGGLPLYRRYNPREPRAGSPAGLVFTPYYTFLNRGPSALQVWVETAGQ